MKYLSLILFLLLMSALPVLGQNQITQRNKVDSDSIIIEKGIVYKRASFPLFIDPIYKGPSDPVVCYNKKVKKWYMYYTSRRLTVDSIKPIEQVHGTLIGIAESSDSGATWRYKGNCNIDYKPDANPTYWAPEIFKYKNLYHMFLSYVPGIFDSWDHPRNIVHLTSKNGVDWKTYGIVDLGNRVIDACIYHLPNGHWRMWYKNESVKSNLIWYADSKDLYHWTVKGPASLGGVNGEGPNVFFWHNKYYLVVDEWKGLSVFSSDDATVWKKQKDYLVAGVPLESTDGGHSPFADGSQGNHADIEVVGNHAYIFYFSDIPSYMKQHGLAVYVQDLIYHEDGTVSCDTTRKCYINLNANN